MDCPECGAHLSTDNVWCYSTAVQGEIEIRVTCTKWLKGCEFKARKVIKLDDFEPVRLTRQGKE